MLNRRLVDFGLPPYIGYALSLLAFIGFCVYIFLKTAFAPYILIGLGLSFLLQLSESGRNNALKSYFPKEDFVKLRLMENAIVALPFLVVLVFNLAILSAIAFLLAALGMIFFKFENKLNLTIPTPFSKRPFEFTVGFRSTFPLILFTYFLGVMAVIADNFNLAVFSQVTVIAICLSYYGKPEDAFYVWTFSESPKSFLLRKIKTAILQSSMLAIPIVVLMLIFFPEQAILIAAFQVVGFLYLATLILAKYSAFPQGINLPQSVMLAVSFLFIPVLPVFTAYFYNEAKGRLKILLDDQN